MDNLCWYYISNWSFFTEDNSVCKVNRNDGIFSRCFVANSTDYTMVYISWLCDYGVRPWINLCSSFPARFTSRFIADYRYPLFFSPEKCEEALHILILAKLTLTTGDCTWNGFAYNRTAATIYADDHALTYNDDYKSFAPNDCTNFKSQCLRVGGYQYGLSGLLAVPCFGSDGE